MTPPFLLTEKSPLSSGVTLVELLLSMMIGSIIILTAFSLLGTGVDQYQRIISQSLDVGHTSHASRLIRRDLDRRHRGLPISLGKGQNGAGIDLVAHFHRKWTLSDLQTSGLIKESLHGYPNDQIGFFINLPSSLSAQYGGFDLAHVLYVTALTPNSAPENLSTPTNPIALGYSRRLFRIFTPPGQVYALLNKIQSEGLASLPRGYTLKDQVVSIVAERIALFQVEGTGTLISQASHSPIVIQNCLDDISLLSPSLFSGSPLAWHQLLEAPPLSMPKGFRLTQLAFTLKVCPKKMAPTLTVEDWNTMTGDIDPSLGRNKVPLFPYSFSYHL